MRRSADFRRVLARGKRKRRGGVTVVVSPGPGDETRIGLVVGKAVGGAVDRNRVKRRLRHALQDIPLEQAMDYVIIGDRPVADATFGQLRRWLGDAIEGLR